MTLNKLSVGLLMVLISINKAAIVKSRYVVLDRSKCRMKECEEIKEGESDQD